MQIGQSSVSRLIGELTQDWLKEGTFNINEARKAELAEINALELEAWDAWKRSRGTKKKETKTTGISAQGNHVDETSETKWREVGDPRFLTQVQWCINKRCELLGLDSPKKMDVDGPAFRSLTDWVQAINSSANDGQ